MEGRTQKGEKGAPDLWAFYHSPWEGEFLDRFCCPRRIIRIACPFVKLRNARLLLASIPPPSGGPTLIKFLTRLNVRDCRSHVHDVTAMELLLDCPVSDRAKVEIRIDNSLHAKLYIFDEDESIVTSSNLTYAGFNTNLEAALCSKVQSTVQSTIDYFEAIFSDARPLGVSDTAEIRRALGLHAASLPEYEVEGDEGRDDSEGEPDPDAEEIPESVNVIAGKLDHDSVERIDLRLKRDLRDSLADGLLSTRPESPFRTVTENEFFEEVADKHRRLFGDPVPDRDGLATLYVHPSAKSLETASYDDAFATRLCALGTAVENLIIMRLLLKGRGGRDAVYDLVSTAGFIKSSDHLARQLHKAGLSGLLVGRGFDHGAELDPELPARAVHRMGEQLLGYLYRTHAWDDLLRTCGRLLQIEEEFPFESYADQNFKSLLQGLSQDRYGAAPSYEVVSRRGPDHDAAFEVVAIVGKRKLGTGVGRSKKSAETIAAHNGLKSFSGSEFARSTKRETRVPGWLEKKCSSAGQKMVKGLIGRTISQRSLLAVLVPPGRGSTGYRTLRDRLAALGGEVRAVLSCDFYFEGSDDGAHLGKLVSLGNSQREVIGNIRGTPLFEWHNALAENTGFSEAVSPRSVLHTVNALLGAALVEHGMGTCQKLGNFLFRHPEAQGSGSTDTPKNIFLNAVQAVCRERTKGLVKYELQRLHKPNEEHAPRWKSTVYLDGHELGDGIGKSRKEAEALSSERSLENPMLKDILDKLALESTGSGEDAGPAA